MYFVDQYKRQFFASMFSFADTWETGPKPEEIKKKTEESGPANPNDIKKAKGEVEKTAKKMDVKSAEFRAQQERLRGGLATSGGIEKNEKTVESRKNIEKPLTSQEAEKVFQELPKGEGDMVIPERVQSEVLKSLAEKPIDTTNMTPDEIRQEVEARTVAAKVAEMGTREIPGNGPHPGTTEAEYIKGLEEKYGLTGDALMSIRARNQAGIGGEIDITGKINDPEVYKAEMETLAQNAKKAQDYIAANKEAYDAGNATIAANATAILEGKDPATLTDAQRTEYGNMAINDGNLGEGYSSLGRLSGNSSGGFESTGSGVGNVNLDPGQLANLPPTNPEKAGDLGKMFGSAITKYGSQFGIPKEWANDPNLHKVVMKESGGIVGRLNYCFGPVAKRMGTKIDDPQFITFVHNKLKAGATAGDFGIRSVATGVGQMIKANVEKYYPDKLQGIGDADNECIGMLQYIKERYKTPANVVAQYGKHHEGY